jgi:hypothetical protein
LAVNEAAERASKFWTILYPQLALLAGDLPDFAKLAIAHRDLKAALRSAHTPAGDPWAVPSRTTIRIADEPCIGVADE